MSYAVPTPPTKSRPGVVQTAVYLLWAVVGLSIITALLTFVPTPELDRALDDFYARNPDTGSQAVATLGMIGGIVFALVLAGAFAALAVFVGRGSQPARITTWVVGGILALCQGCGFLSNLAMPALLEGMTAGGDPSAQAAAEEARIIREFTPGWLTAASTAISLLLFLAILAAIILLATPKANDYFRKEEQVWVPPTSSSGGYPQYPPPAIPQNPGAPPVPPAPPAQPPTPPTQS